MSFFSYRSRALLFCAETQPVPINVFVCAVGGWKGRRNNNEALGINENTDIELTEHVKDGNIEEAQNHPVVSLRVDTNLYHICSVNTKLIASQYVAQPKSTRFLV